MAETMTESEILAAWIVACIAADEDPERRKKALSELRHVAAIYRSTPGYGEWWA